MSIYSGARVRPRNEKMGEIPSICDFSNSDGTAVVGDRRSYSSGMSISSGLNTLTVLGKTFDTPEIGKTVRVNGAGASGGADLVALIASISSGNAVLDTAAGTTVASAAGFVGRMHTTGIQKAINSCKPGSVVGGTGLYVPSANYLTDQLKIWLGTRLVGGGCWVNDNEWQAGTLWQAPNSNKDLVISGFDPNIFRWTATATAATDVIAAAGHSFHDGESVFFETTGALPAPLAINTRYYARDVVDGVSLKVSASVDGVAIDVTTTGSGTHTIRASGDYLHAAMLQDICLVGDRRTNKRGSGFNFYRAGENLNVDRVWSLRFPRHGGRIYDFGAPPHLGRLSAFYCGTTLLNPTADAVNNIIFFPGHGFVDGEMVFIQSTATMPAPLIAWKPYYVRDATANAFKLAGTLGGAAIDITSAGTGTLTVKIGFGFCFEPGQNSLNNIVEVSSDNCHVAAVGIVNCFSTSVLIHGLKVERSATEGVGNPVGLMGVNLNGGIVAALQTNVYTSEPGAQALVMQCHDDGSGGGEMQMDGCGVSMRAGFASDFAYGYQHVNAGLTETVADWLNKKQLTSIRFPKADRVVRPAIDLATAYSHMRMSGGAYHFPNQINFNAVNHAAPDQGGFISSNAHWSGDFAIGWLQSSTIYTFTANAGTDVISIAGHPYINDQTVYVKTTGSLPAPLAASTQYWVRDVVAGVSFKLAASFGGAAINITTAGTGTHTMSVSFRGQWIRLAPELFELGFGEEATNTLSLQPMAPMLAMNYLGRAWLGKLAKNIGGTATLLIMDNGGGVTQVNVRAGSTQGANDLFQWSNHAGSVRAAVRDNGDIITLGKFISPGAGTLSRPAYIDSAGNITTDLINLASGGYVTGILPTGAGGTGSAFATFAALVVSIMQNAPSASRGHLDVYSIAQVDALLATRDAQITALQTAMNLKSVIGHSHTGIAQSGASPANHQHSLQVDGSTS